MEDPRCCGTGTCIINDDGQCWCGQTWDGERMCFAPAASPSTSTSTSTSRPAPVADHPPPAGDEAPN